MILHDCVCSASLCFPSDLFGRQWMVDGLCQGPCRWKDAEKAQRAKRMWRKEQKTLDLQRCLLWIWLSICRHAQYISAHTNSNKDSENWMWAMRSMFKALPLQTAHLSYSAITGGFRQDGSRMWGRLCLCLQAEHSRLKSWDNCLFQYNERQ